MKRPLLPRKPAMFLLAAPLLLPVHGFGLSSSRAVAAATPPMTVRLLAKTGPHSISLYPHNGINFYFRVKNLKLGAHMGPNAQDHRGRGHIEIYLDRVPKDAYRKLDVSHIFNNAVPNLSRCTIAPDDPWVKEYRGKHTLLVVLAKNDDVLYRGVKPARFKLTVK